MSELERLIESKLALYGQLTETTPELISVDVQDSTNFREKDATFSFSFLLGNKFDVDAKQTVGYTDYGEGVGLSDTPDQNITYVLKDQDGNQIGRESWIGGSSLALDVSMGNYDLLPDLREEYVHDFFKILDVRFAPSWMGDGEHLHGFYDRLLFHLVSEKGLDLHPLSQQEQIHDWMEEGNLVELVPSMDALIATEEHPGKKAHMLAERKLIIEHAKDQARLHDMSVPLEDKGLVLDHYIVEGDPVNSINVIIFEELTEGQRLAPRLTKDLERTGVFGGSNVYSTGFVADFVEAGQTGQLDMVLLESGESDMVNSMNLLAASGSGVEVTQNGKSLGADATQVAYAEKTKFQKMIEARLDEKDAEHPKFLVIPSSAESYHLGAIVANVLDIDYEAQESGSLRLGMRLSSQIDRDFDTNGVADPRGEFFDLYNKTGSRQIFKEKRLRDARLSAQVLEWDTPEELNEGMHGLLELTFPLQMDDISPGSFAQKLENVSHVLKKNEGIVNTEDVSFKAGSMYSLMATYSRDSYYLNLDGGEKQFHNVMGSTYVLTQAIADGELLIKPDEVWYSGDYWDDEEPEHPLRKHISDIVPGIMRMAAGFANQAYWGGGSSVSFMEYKPSARLVYMAKNMAELAGCEDVFRRSYEHSSLRPLPQIEKPNLP